MKYTGVDLHKDNCYMTTMTSEGEILRQCRVRNDATLILDYFKTIEGPHKVVIESTGGWYWFNDLLDGEKNKVVLAHSKHVKAIAYAKVKTDKVDSGTLTILLRADLISPAHKISKELRDLRDTMRTRLRLVQKRTSCYNSIHRIAEKFNCDQEVDLSKSTIPDGIPELYKTQMEMFYQQSELLDSQISILEKKVYGKLKENDDINRLQTIPGVGKLTALTVYLEIDGIERFASVKNFLSYCRLVPGAKDSNKRRKHSSGNKEGNKYLKIAFSNAAVHAKRYSEDIRKYHHKMLRRTNKAIAMTLVAKELGKIVYCILKDGTEYKGFKSSVNDRRLA